MAKPTISVITIVRNNRAFIGDTIRSVIDQSYPHVEYLVIDGASTDGTLDIIRSFEGKISRWISEPDQGIADAFNKGLALATGDYIIFLNSDDAFADHDALRKVAEAIEANDFPAMLYGDCDVLERDSGRVLYRAVIPFSKEKLGRGYMLPHPSMFTHRSYFEKYGKFDTNFRIAMDYEWLLRGGMQERIVHVPLLVTNVRSGGISTQNKGRVVNEIIAALRKNGYIRSTLGEYRMRGYFLLRSFGKIALASMGLYKIFSTLRNRRADASPPE